MAIYTDMDSFLRRLFPSETKTKEIEEITQLAAAASRYFDRQTKRPDNYYQAAAVDAVADSGDAATERPIYGNGKTLLRLPPFADAALTPDKITTIDGQTVPPFIVVQDSDNFFDSMGQNRSLQIVAASGAIINDPNIAAWPYGVPFLITAHWGAVAIRPDIQTAVEMITKYWFQKPTGGGVLGQVQPGPYIQDPDIPKAAKSIIDSYRLEAESEYGPNYQDASEVVTGAATTDYQADSCCAGGSRPFYNDYWNV